MTQPVTILLVGGYGHVGKLIAEGIRERSSAVVIIAGRDSEKAKKIARETDTRFQWTAFDVDKFGEHERELVDRSDIIVVCLDQSKLDFAKYCLQRGKIYLDITAKSDFLEQLRRLDGLAKVNRSLAVVGLGLCPGLTNLVAAELKAAFPDADKIVTGLLLFLGEAHGRASIEWTLDNYTNDFVYSGKLQRSFGSAFPFSFPGFSKDRYAYRFNFSDQHALKDTYEQCDFATYLCFDSALVTRLLYVLKVCRVDGVLKVRWIKSFFVRLLSAFSFGQTGFSGESVAISNGKSVGRITFSGGHTGLATAAVLVETVIRVVSMEKMYGVKHIHELFRLDQFRTFGSIEIGNLR